MTDYEKAILCHGKSPGLGELRSPLMMPSVSSWVYLFRKTCFISCLIWKMRFGLDVLLTFASKPSMNLSEKADP